MAIRNIKWTVGADCKTVTPAAAQDGGVQGEDHAATVAFDLTAAPRLTDGTMTFYIECIDSMGGYDKTQPLSLTEGAVTAPVPLAWTQHGGVTTLRLVCEAAGVIAYTLEGRLRFAGRQTAARQVDSLLRTHIQQTLDEMDGLHTATQEAAGTAHTASRQAADAANEAAVYAGQAAASADGAQDALAATREQAAIAAEAARNAAAAQERIARLTVPDDSTVRSDGLWSSRNIVERLCPPFEEAGSVVQAYPVEGYPLAVRTDEPYDYLELDYALEECDGLQISRAADGGYVLNGTMGGSGCLYLSCPVGTMAEAFGLDPAETYRLSGCPAGGSAEGYRLELWEDSSGTVRVMDTGEGATFVPGDYAYEWVWILSITMPAGTVCEDLTFRPRITRVADTPTTITRCGKNLLRFPYDNGTKTAGSTTFTPNEDGSISMATPDTGATSNATYVLYGKGTGLNAAILPAVIVPSRNYTLWAQGGLPDGVTLNVYLYNADGEPITSKLVRPTAPSVTFAIPADIARWYVYLRVSPGTVLDGTTVHFQLEFGTAATAYEPYWEETFPVDESGITTVPAVAGCNTLWADKGEVAVTGRLDPVHILQGLM